MADVAFRCTCGTLHGHLRGIGPAAGTNCVCYCNSCRSAEIFLGQPDPAPQPVPLYQTTPDRVVIEGGADRLAVLRLSDKTNTYRWYAACCNAPLAITGPSPGMPFVSVNLARVADRSAFGPVRTKAFVPKKGGGTTHTNLLPFVWGLLSRAAAARLSGRWKDTPFFDPATRAPKGPVRLLTPDERAALPLKG